VRIFRDRQGFGALGLEGQGAGRDGKHTDRGRLVKVGRANLVALTAVWVLGLAAASPGAAHPRCFGAASRDPYRPCHNRRLALTVYPTPAEAQIETSSPCWPIKAAITVCAFGVPAAHASGEIALVGDSHAWHWRPALDVVARALHWHAIEATRSSCAFTAGVPRVPEPRGASCGKWNRSVLRWLQEQPQISTVFTSNHPMQVDEAPGQGRFAAEVAGITDAWAKLPATVKHIVVIHDTPYMREDVLQCIEEAIRAHKDAGASCAEPRSKALFRDPNVVAAEQLHSRRIQVIDLTRFFCDFELCYPVVGGALVYRNPDHLTATFATTAGPYLLQSLRQLMKTWR
jgi:hypothetical protein